MKILTKDSLEALIKNLETVQKPVKETYTRKEAIEALKPTIRELKKRGFSLADIAQVINEQSQKELRMSQKELKEILDGRKRPNSSHPTQPSQAGKSSEENVSDEHDDNDGDEVSSEEEAETE